jgi:hypothetical protein
VAAKATEKITISKPFLSSPPKKIVTFFNPIPPLSSGEGEGGEVQKITISKPFLSSPPKKIVTFFNRSPPSPLERG